MAEGEEGANIEGIEQELETIQAFLSTDHSPDEAMQMLARQGVLLIAKSGVYMQRRAFDAAVKTARDAASLIEGLQSRAVRRDLMLVFDLEAHWFEAHSVVGLAQVESRDLVAARKTLRFLQGQLRKVKNDNIPKSRVALLEKALDAEAQKRLDVFYAQEAERQAEGELFGHDWSETHLILDTLVEEIAERMAFASALVGRVSHPERFQEFVVERLRGSLRKTRQQQVGAISHVEVEIRQQAEARGRRMQAIVWESSEMLTAPQLKFPDGAACSDEALTPAREARRILGLPHPDDATRFAYPRWQFGPHQQIVASVFRELKHLPAWSVWHFFHQGLAYLFDLSPLGFLRVVDEEERAPRFARLIEEHGDAEKVLVAAARDYVLGND